MIVSISGFVPCSSIVLPDSFLRDLLGVAVVVHNAGKDAVERVSSEVVVVVSVEDCDLFVRRKSIVGDIVTVGEDEQVGSTEGV